MDRAKLLAKYHIYTGLRHWASGNFEDHLQAIIFPFNEEPYIFNESFAAAVIHTYFLLLKSTLSIFDILHAVTAHCMLSSCFNELFSFTVSFFLQRQHLPCWQSIFSPWRHDYLCFSLFSPSTKACSSCGGGGRLQLAKCLACSLWLWEGLGCTIYMASFFST